MAIFTTPTTNDNHDQDTHQRKSSYSPHRHPSFIYFESPRQEVSTIVTSTEFSLPRSSGMMALGQSSKFAALSADVNDDSDESKPANNKKAKQKAKKKNKQPQQSTNTNSKRFVSINQQQSPPSRIPKNSTNVSISLSPPSTSLTSSGRKQKNNKEESKALKTTTKQSINDIISSLDSSLSYNSLRKSLPDSSMTEAAHTFSRTLSSSSIQNIFIWSVSTCYLFAFLSFYYQIRGLI